MARTKAETAKSIKDAKAAAKGTAPIVDGNAPPVEATKRPAHNPAISEAPKESKKADAPLDGAEEVETNQDGFVPGAQLTLAEIMGRRSKDKRGEA